MSECHFFLSLRSPPTRASLCWSLSAVLSTREDASKEPNQGKESKAKRVSNVFCHPSLVHFLTLLFPSLFATKSKQAPPLSKASPAYPLRLGTRQRSQNKVRSSSRTRFSSLFNSFSNSASSFVSLSTDPQQPVVLAGASPASSLRVSRASAS